LNYDTKKDFVIELDDVWKWIGFTRKDNARKALEKYFVENIDYKILLHQMEENSQKNIFLHLEENSQKDETQKFKEIPKLGRPTEQIMMTVNTFKKFCLKAGTKKADQIHDYYIKLEEL